MLKTLKLLLIIFIGLSFMNTKTNATSISQSEIINISERLRLNELELKNLEIYKNLLQAQQKQQEQQLSFYKKEINRNIISLYKLSTSSLKLLFANEQSKKDTLISYSLLSYYIDHIKQEINKAKNYIILIEKNEEEIQELEQKIQKNTSEIQKNTKLIKDYATNKNYTSLELQKLRETNSNLIKESKNISNLIIQLNKKHYLPSELETDKQILSEQGHFVWPNAGFLESAFKKSKNPLYYNGIVMVTLSNSQIVSPAKGEVLFVDEFDNFNQIIIIKHSPNIYSIISGKISPIVKQLQLVKKHEPIALANKNVSTIYFEIKHNNVSVDPSLWLHSKDNTQNKKN